MTHHEIERFKLFVVEGKERHDFFSFFSTELIVQYAYADKFQFVFLEGFLLDGFVEEIEIFVVHDMLLSRLFPAMMALLRSFSNRMNLSDRGRCFQ